MDVSAGRDKIFGVGRRWIRATGECHGHFQFGPEEFENMSDSYRTGGGQAVQDGSPEHDGIGSTAKRFEDVGSSTNSAIKQNRNLVSHSFDNFR